MANHGNGTRTLEPLRSGRSAATLRLQLLMEAQHRHEIGQRIKDLRNGSPQSNRSIADYVGVGERAVAQWIAGGGIAWENAKKVAELFDVDVQWIWTGREKGPTPEVLEALSGDSERLARIEEELVEMRIDLAELGVEIARDKAQQQIWNKKANDARTRAKKRG